MGELFLFSHAFVFSFSSAADSRQQSSGRRIPSLAATHTTSAGVALHVPHVSSALITYNLAAQQQQPVVSGAERNSRINKPRALGPHDHFLACTVERIARAARARLIQQQHRRDHL